MGLRLGWRLLFLGTAVGGLTASRAHCGASSTVVGWCWGLLGGDSLHPGCTLVRPGWRLYCRLGLLGLVISAEGVLRCSLGGG